ncbi:hypothetical protein ACEPAI_9046 [Sanghuangporus weigelae]
MSSTPSYDKPLPPISRPKRLQRSKSMATTVRSSSRSRSSSKSRRGSMASGSSQGSNSGKSMMQIIIQALNTPIVEPEHRRKSRSSLTDSSSVFSRFRRSEEKRKADEEPPTLRHLKSASSLRTTTMSLLSDYGSFRNSIMSGSVEERTRSEIVESATRYYTSMLDYLKEVDSLPPVVRDTLEVQRLHQQLKFTAELLSPANNEEQSEQAILLLDNTLMLVKKLLSDVQNLLLQQTEVPSRFSEEEHRDEDECREEVQEGEIYEEESSSTEGVYEYDIPDTHLAILITEPDDEPPKPVRGGLRKMKSSMAVLGGGSSRVEEPARDSGYGTADSQLESPSEEQPKRSLPSRRVRFSQQENLSRYTVVDLSENIEDVSHSLSAVNACPLFADDARSETPISKSLDTVDVTYGQDGIPVAMSSAAIIEQLIQDLELVPVEKKETPIANFSDIIFTTFRFFWEPEEFLEQLEATYDGTYLNDRKLSVALLVRLWVLAYWLPQDSQKKGLIKKVQRFLGKALSDGFVWGTILIDMLTRLEQYAENPDRSAIIREVPEMQYEAMPFRFVDFSRDMPLLRGSYQNIRVMAFNNSTGCMELARQLTLKESALYLRLTAREVISRFIVTDEENKEASLAREKMGSLKDFSCIVYRWAAWNILRRPTPFKRAKAFGFMMRLAKYLLSLRNFSSAHSVFNGALSIHLDILFQTEAELMPKTRKNMAYIAKFFDDNKDISMQSSAQPTVPIMATYAGKLTRLLESKGIMVPSKVDESVKLVNISFFRAATRITYAMESNQHPYDFKAHAPLQEFIDYIFKEVPSEDEIYEQYLKIKHEEQSGAPFPKPGLMRRLRTNSMMTLPKF